MTRTLLCLFALPALLAAQYKSGPSGAPPAEVAAPIAALLQPAGLQVVGPAGPVEEIWFVKAAPSGPKSTEDSVTLPTVPVGSVLGVIRFLKTGADRRGQQIKPGVYTLRYVQMPVNGDHLGAAPQRDFAAMIPAANDKDAATVADWKQVVEMSTKASNTAHPAVLSLASGSGTDGFTKEGDHDWTWNTKMGDVPVAVILLGKAE